jgi:uncharacterized repeat protein (TIGR03803 family)
MNDALCRMAAWGTLGILAAAAGARAASPTFHSLYAFSGGRDGGTPTAPVTIGNGVLYGTTTFGGPGGLGVVFSLTPPATPGAWTETVLHNFTLQEGFSPFGSVVVGADGVLYGTTYLGGPSIKSGTVFSLTPPASPGGAWTETTLHAFTGAMGVNSDDGGNSSAPVVIGAGGVLYGTTTYGGTHGQGTVFSLAPPASAGGTWTEAILHNFGGGGDGIQPIAGLIIDSEGTLYGTTYGGGPFGGGTVFSLKPPDSPGGTWTESVLYAFTGGNDGGAPYYGSLVMDSSGVLYGTTETGGASLTGTVFSLKPPAAPGGSWTEAVLYNFTSLSGKLPLGGLAINAAGDLFGTTSTGGHSSDGAGAVFRLTPPASPGGAWQYNVLHTFTYGSAEGEMPYSGVVIGPGRVLFGATSGLDPFGSSSPGNVYAVRP